jgi:tetratricopeptide (TPR) repeat protein
LAFRKVPLPSEIGRIDLFAEAGRGARAAGRPQMATVIGAIANHERNYSTDKFHSLSQVAVQLAANHEYIEPWLLQELQPRGARWIETLADQLVLTPPALADLAALNRLFFPADAEARTASLREKALRQLMKSGSYRDALKLLEQIPQAEPRLVAECREGLGDLPAAADEYLRAGSPADALRCYRGIPDFEKALELLDRVGDHPARASLEWLRQMRDLAAARPPEFSRTVLPAEKKLLEQVLEASLGVSRKKPAAKKSAAKKAPVKRAPVKKAPVPRTPPPKPGRDLF